MKKILLQFFFSNRNKKAFFSLIVFLTFVSYSNAQNEYYNSTYNFSFNYSTDLVKLTHQQLQNYVSVASTNQMDISPIVGFVNRNEQLSPLVIVNYVQNIAPEEFNDIVTEFEAMGPNICYKNISDIDLSTMIRSNLFEKTVIDKSKKVILFNFDMFVGHLWPQDSDGHIIMGLFFGDQQVIQIGFTSTKNSLHNSFTNYFQEIIQSFEVNGKKANNNVIDSDYNSITQEANQITQDFLNGKFLKFNSFGSKSKGLQFSLKYPADWESKEGDRPHILQKFVKNHTEYLIIIGIAVNEYESSTTEEEIDSMIEMGIPQNLIPEGTRYNSIRKSYLESQPVLILDSDVQKSRLGVVFQSRTQQYLIYYKNFSIEIFFSIVKDQNNYLTDIEKVFNNYEQLFIAIANSFVLDSKWLDN